MATTKAQRKQRHADRKSRQIEDRLLRVAEELQSIQADVQALTDHVEDDRARWALEEVGGDAVLGDLVQAVTDAGLKARFANMEIHDCADHAEWHDGTDVAECARCGDVI